jgi:uroporphyrin-III C-methyltransferase / precorrin-2 dehydrogenase / sirohydrochlorin ferrochelatase
MKGFVSLIGAGPGDPELLTRKAARRLAEADVVLYDALVDRTALELAPRAQRVFVGKRAGRPAVRQEFIHQLMIRMARQGRRIVRLKGGDPFVFGRGGEEALALSSAGVAFEVVPGVSAAIAAPALAGIPVTHRGVASAFLFVSGHAESSYAPVIDGVAPNCATLVVLMGIGQIRQIADRLLSRGWQGATPVALLFGASTAVSDVQILTLADLGERSDGFEQDSPGTIVVGDVVRLRQAMSLVEQGPGEAGHYEVAYA